MVFTAKRVRITKVLVPLTADMQVFRHLDSMNEIGKGADFDVREDLIMR